MSSYTSEALAELAVATLTDNKALDIKTINVRALTDITDLMIICSATSTRHANTLADKLLRSMREAGIRPAGMEGEQQGDWILVDLHDIVVHIMLKETREFYDLEKLWAMTEKSRKPNEN